jgi:hypothetical protein
MMHLKPNQSGPFYRNSPGRLEIGLFEILESRIANTRSEPLVTLKPHDIVVLLKLLKAGSKRPTYAQLAVDLYMSPSEVHASIRRARAARLIHGPELGDRVNARALEEFLVHGIKYAFPPEKGGMTRGIPTASAAEPLNREMTQEEPIPVWPFEEGDRRGYAFLPLYKRAPQAALKDRELYQLLALVDSLRDGSARQRELAKRELSARLKS